MSSPYAILNEKARELRARGFAMDVGYNTLTLHDREFARPIADALTRIHVVPLQPCLGPEIRYGQRFI